MSKKEKLHVDSIVVHAGYSPENSTKARAVPIYQTTAYAFDSTQHAADLFALKTTGNIYTRLMNPTTDVLEKRVAALEGGSAALAVSSGQSAIMLALLNIAQAGDEIVSADNLYGGTYSLFRYTFSKMGIKVRFAKANDLTAIKAAITSKTKAIYAETIGNPKLNITNISLLSEIAHEHGIPLIVDNTVAPYLIRPIDFGADIVVYSATKFLEGHGTSLGGIIVDSGRFNWTQNNKFPLIAGPEASYHDLDFVEALKSVGNIAYIVKARVTLLRDMGPALSPFNAFLILHGMETLHLRMPRHCSNALAVAKFLKQHSQVSWVNYPGLEDHIDHVLAKKYLSKGAGALIGFGIKGGLEAGKRFIDSLKFVSHVANLGDARTLAVHPASTTHQQLSDEEQMSCGVSQDFIRLSIGIEHIDDILFDINQALESVKK